MHMKVFTREEFRKSCGNVTREEVRNSGNQGPKRNLVDSHAINPELRPQEIPLQPDGADQHQYTQNLQN